MYARAKYGQKELTKFISLSAVTVKVEAAGLFTPVATVHDLHHVRLFHM